MDGTHVALARIVAAALAASLAGVAGAAVVVLAPAAARQRAMVLLVAYAAGALLAAALLGLIPEAIERGSARTVLATVLVTLIACFLLEQVLLWRHCHDVPCEGHRAAVPLVVIGDGLHNFVDGAAIAAAFLHSVELGVGTTLAVVAHEVPQEIGDFALLLDAGQSVRRALALNAASALACVGGALVGYLSLARVDAAVPHVLAVSAATFLYIALVDLLADFHHRVGPLLAAQRLVSMAAGIATMGWVVPR
jgi:zinc and cadmium transporter